MADAKTQSAAATALRAIRQGRTDDAAVILQQCLAGAPMATAQGSTVVPGGRQYRAGAVNYHVFTTPNIGGIPNDGNLHKVSIQWPTTGKNMRVIAMMGSVLSGSVADMSNVSVGLECNNQQQLVASGRAVKQAPYSCLFPTAEARFPFVTTRKQYGVPIFSTENWTATFFNEGGTGASISPTLEFLIEHDLDGSAASFDVDAYGKDLGVYLFRPDNPAAVPNASGAGNPSTPQSIYFSTGKPNQRVVAWIGSVQSAANVQDLTNATIMVSPNGTEMLVTNGQGVGLTLAAAPLGSMFGNNGGRAERWLPFSSRATNGIDVPPDEQWQIVFANLGSASGNLNPSIVFRCETD